MPSFTRHKQLSSSQIILIGFAVVILIGSLLLMLPIASRDGHITSFPDTLFTATSAVCVTGLVVQDTGTYWSLFGQVVILALIQTGGMGVITLSIAFTTLSRKKIGLRQRSIMQDAISAPKVAGIVKLTRFIIKMTLFFEAAGALLMLPVFCREFGIRTGIWYSVFHSVSAFCNAGFDLMGIKGNFSSLSYFAGNPVINLVIMALIIIGGIGFLTWADFHQYHFRFRKYSMQSKVILTTTFLLILFPAVYFFFGECNDLPLTQRILASFFQSVTPRTAGFNTVDISNFHETGIAIIILLMLTGGSPGSTAGGMKTTTLAVLFFTALQVFRRKEYTQFFQRRISDKIVRSAITLLMMYLLLSLSGGFIISRLEHLPLLTCLYETASAIGTAGLSLGITPSLGTISHIILIILMYIGRVGGLTLIFATATGYPNNTSKYPQEPLTVG